MPEGSPSTTLPAGWHWYEAKPAATDTNAGFKLGVPDGWQVHEGSNSLQYFVESPANATFFEIDLTPHTFSQMVPEAWYLAKETAQKGYFTGRADQTVRAVHIRNRPGAAWGFTWQQSGVGRTRALDLLYIAATTAGSQSYALYMTAPDTAFNGNLHTFIEAVRTFQPVP